VDGAVVAGCGGIWAAEEEETTHARAGPRFRKVGGVAVDVENHGGGMIP